MSTLTVKQRYDVVQINLDKLDSFVSDCNKLREMELWNTLANRIYYATFQAVTALMISDGIEVKSHNGVVTLFGKHYVLTGKYSTADAQLYSQLQSLRELADYNGSFYTTRDKIIPLYDRALDLINRIRASLNEVQKQRLSEIVG